MTDSPFILLLHQIVCILLIAIAVNATVLIFFGDILPTWVLGTASLTIGAAAMRKPIKKTILEISQKNSKQ